MAAPVKSPDHSALGAAMRELREEHRLSQEELALEAGLHRNYVGACERGEVNIAFENQLRLVRALNEPLSELVRRYEQRAG